jgi:putative ATPase
MYYGKDKILYRTIKADRLSSIILFGPPGCGKTSLARVISETTKYKFYKINAVSRSSRYKKSNRRNKKLHAKSNRKKHIIYR